MLFYAPYDDTHPLYYRISNSLQLRRFYAVEAGYGKIPPGLRQITTRNIYILHYITAGKGVFCDQQFDTEHAYLVAPGEYENFISDINSPYESYWIMFNGSDSDEMLKNASLPQHNSVFKFSENEKCAEIIHRVLFDMKPKNEYEEAYLLQAALYEIFAVHMHTVTEIPKSNTTPETQLKEFIDDNFFREIDINELIKKMRCSRTAIFKAFKKAYKTTPHEYLLELRILKSKELLINKLNNFSIGEVSQIVGFNDPLYFSRIFRKKIGMPPSEFKKQFRVKGSQTEKSLPK